MCERCSGLMVPEKEYDENRCKWMPYHRCLNCGHHEYSEMRKRDLARAMASSPYDRKKSREEVGCGESE